MSSHKPVKTLAECGVCRRYGPDKKIVGNITQASRPGEPGGLYILAISKKEEQLY